MTAAVAAACGTLTFWEVYENGAALAQTLHPSPAMFALLGVA